MAQHVQLLGALHALILLILGWRSARRLVAGALRRVAAAYLLTWANLVVTGLGLGAVAWLDEVGLYFATSMLLAVALNAGLRLGRVAPPAEAEQGDGDGAPPDRWVRRALLATFAVAALASLVICVAYVPNNWDSGTYRLSRAFFYLGRGDLLHVGSADPRQSYYPLNGALWYVFPAIYQLAPQWMASVTYLAWLLTGVGVYLGARALGASRTGSVAAAWLCCLAPSVLAQATATTDEVLTAVPILLGLVFGLEFWSAGRRRDAVLAGIGVGLGLGTKLHWVFYAVFVLGAAIAILVWAVRAPAFRAVLARRLPMLVVATAIAAALSTPFMVFNYISRGEVTSAEFNNLVLNNPFRLRLALEKLRVNTAELFLSPIPDLVPPVDRAQRKAAYAAFNAFFMRCCFGDLVEVVKRPYPGRYAFQGPTNPEGYLFYEYTWLGFLPALFLLVGAVAVAARGRLPPACLVLVLSFFCWHATSAVATRYQEGQIYYSFPAVLAAAAIGPAWDYARRSKGWSARLLTAGFVLVLATHGVLAYNLFQYGGLRNLQFVWKRTAPPDMHPVDPPVVEAVRAARDIYVPFTHWELLYWNVMRFNPAARYSTGLQQRLLEPGTLMLLSITPAVADGLLPIRWPAAGGPGLTYLGRSDSDVMMAQGSGVEARFPDRSGYGLMRFTWSRDAASGAIDGVTAVTCCVGLATGADLWARYDLYSGATGARRGTGWTRAAQMAPLPAAPGQGRVDVLAVETSGGEDRTRVVRSEYRVDGGFYDVGKDESWYGLAISR